jgi:SAM-dependent methyltransferase/uncharacterized protein YbaR (Trm112 family)
MELLDALGCPRCQQVLAGTGDPARPLQCGSCGQLFGAVDGIPVLLGSEDAARLDRLAIQYREMRESEGLQPPTCDQARRLPYSQPAGAPPLYWQVRSQSFRALMAHLARYGPTPAQGPAADLGAGTGWLSYRLSQIGHRVIAVDASRDADWGLGFAQRCYLSHTAFQPVQGDLDQPPLREAGLGLIVFNASLHYAADLESALSRAARALRPAGRIIILDSPVARRPSTGTAPGQRHLGRQELERALGAAGLRARWSSVRRGPRWWLHQARVVLKGDRPFSFPMIVAGTAP